MPGTTATGTMADMSAVRASRTALVVTVALIAATTAQLAVATFATGLPQFEGKAFGSRLVAYPLLMCVPIALWWVVGRRRGARSSLPWAAFAFICPPFLVDVTGNSLNLYDSVTWWDDANHFVNWFLLCLGIGLMLERTRPSRAWLAWLTVTGVGALLAILWELAEWYTFIRHGTAYTDTLGDEALGTLGAAVAGLLLVVRNGATTGGGA